MTSRARTVHKGHVGSVGVSGMLAGQGEEVDVIAALRAPRGAVVGTQADNIRDMDVRGRRSNGGRRGEQIGTARLTDDLVREIRRLYATGAYSQHKLARDLGVSRGSVCDVVIGRRWTHVH